MRVKAGKRAAQSLRTKWMEGKNAECWRGKKGPRRSRKKKNTTRGKGMPVKKWKD
jgi:hypothetical protein